jgi:hypothetical protein
MQYRQKTAPADRMGGISQTIQLNRFYNPI